MDDVNLLDLKRYVDQAVREAGDQADRIEVRIIVKRDFSVGARPSVAVKSLEVGFDWDHGKLLITPETPLREQTLK